MGPYCRRIARMVIALDCAHLFLLSFTFVLLTPISWHDPPRDDFTVVGTEHLEMLAACAMLLTFGGVLESHL